MNTSSIPANDELKQLIYSHRLKRKEVAEMLNVSLPTVHAWLCPDDNAMHRTFTANNLKLLQFLLDERKNKEEQP